MQNRICFSNADSGSTHKSLHHEHMLCLVAWCGICELKQLYGSRSVSAKTVTKRRSVKLPKWTRSLNGSLFSDLKYNRREQAADAFKTRFNSVFASTSGLEKKKLVIIGLVPLQDDL
eukprot:EG_transcript_17621